MALGDGAKDARGWLCFDETMPAEGAGYYRVVPYYYSERGVPGLAVYFGLNQPPVAALTADPQIGQTPLEVNFDASGSTDPEELALSFSWDFEGDGVVDYDSGSDAAVQHTYEEQGDYAPAVHVRDSVGNVATAALPVYSHRWEVHEVLLIGLSLAPR